MKGRCTCGDDDCDSIGKHPLTPNGLKDASADAETIERWWTEAPPANVAILTGPKSRLWVLDLDGQAGVAALAELEARAWRCRGRRRRERAEGGKHLYFAWPAEQRDPEHGQDRREADRHPRIGGVCPRAAEPARLRQPIRVGDLARGGPAGRRRPPGWWTG